MFVFVFVFVFGFVCLFVLIVCARMRVLNPRISRFVHSVQLLTSKLVENLRRA